MVGPSSSPARRKKNTQKTSKKILHPPPRTQPQNTQVIFALPPVGDTDFTMRIYNSDGSEPEMCGNGIRCLARFVADEDGTTAGGKYRIHTLAGLIQPELLADGQVRVDMGEPILEASRVPTTLPGTRDVGGAQGVAVQAPLSVAGREWAMTCVSMGNPHAIVYSRDGGQALKVRGSRLFHALARVLFLACCCLLLAAAAAVSFFSPRRRRSCGRDPARRGGEGGEGWLMQNFSLQ
jgi:diaminopimelate epimerase